MDVETILFVALGISIVALLVHLVVDGLRQNRIDDQAKERIAHPLADYFERLPERDQ